MRAVTSGVRRRPCAPGWWCSATRQLSRLARAASECVPRTPSGRNPYDVVGVELTVGTTLDEVTKAYKLMAVKHHPDQKGGSTDKMTELNMAFRSIKDNHAQVIRNFTDKQTTQRVRDTETPSTGPRGRAHPHQARDEARRRSAGLQNEAAGQATQREKPTREYRSAEEVEAAWFVFRTDTQRTTERVMLRYELALEQAAFHRAPGQMNEIAVRERYLRNNFIAKVWEEVHELRTDLLRRGARNLQMSQLAEDMASFATQTQKKLSSDFERQTQQSTSVSIRIYAVLLFNRFRTMLMLAAVLWYGATTFWGNSYLKTLGPGIRGTPT